MGFHCTVGLHKLQQAGMFLLQISSSVDCLTIECSKPNHLFLSKQNQADFTVFGGSEPKRTESQRSIPVSNEMVWWMTICGYTILVCNQPLGPTQLPTLDGMRNEYQPRRGSWEGDRKSGITVAMRYTLGGIFTYWFSGIGKGHEQLHTFF